MILRLFVALIATMALVTASGALATETDPGEPEKKTTAETSEAKTSPEPDPGMDVKSDANEEPSVDRDKVTTGMIDREPQNEVTTLGNDRSQVYYFTEIHGKPGDQVIHRWEYDGQVMAEVPLEIGGDRWRTFSSKEMMPTWVGEWKVTAIDSSGRVLSQKTFEVVPSQEMMPASAAPAPAE